MNQILKQKPYRGMAMEGFIADWYNRNTGRNLNRFETVAREVSAAVPPGSRVLEVAPGPGYLAIQLAKRGRYQVTGLDISRSFVRIARENAARAGAEIDFQHGDAAHMPFPNGSFDHVVCMAAFKNFSDPVGALNEMHRVLKPGGTASIYDLRKDASLDEIDQEVQGMNLSALSAVFTKWTFRLLLLRRAYHRDALRQMATRSRFGGCEIVEKGIGLEMRCKS
jgi:ubiquinone/menaquinone biosynthesis C-methylase UbiE